MTMAPVFDMGNFRKPTQLVGDDVFVMRCLRHISLHPLMVNLSLVWQCMLDLVCSLVGIVDVSGLWLDCWQDALKCMLLAMLSGIS